MTKNFLCLFSIKRMWELLGTLRSRWSLYFSEVLPSWGQLIEMSLPLEVGPPRLRLGRSGVKLPSETGRIPAAKGILVHFRHKCLLEEFHNQWINHNAVDQKATSASGGGGMAPLSPSLDPPWSSSSVWLLHYSKHHLLRRSVIWPTSMTEDIQRFSFFTIIFWSMSRNLTLEKPPYFYHWLSPSLPLLPVRSDSVVVCHVNRYLLTYLLIYLLTYLLLTLQVLIYPKVTATNEQDLTSYQEYKDGPVVGIELINWWVFWCV